MFFLRSPLQTLSFLIVFAVMFSLGPSLESFTSKSLIEFATFYANLGVIACAGALLKGPINRRFIIVLSFSLIANYYVFYSALEMFTGNIYAQFWTMCLGSTSIYIILNYYTFFQCKSLSLMEKIGVPDNIADAIVGPIGTTNLMISFSFYACFWLTVDFSIAVYSITYGIIYGLPFDGRITTLFTENKHFNIFVIYDSLILLVNAFFTIILAHRIYLDQKRPDALGVGRSMTWNKS